VEVGVTKYVHKYNRRGKITGVDKVDYTYYMTQKDFSSGTYANEVDLSDYEPDLIEKFGVIQEKITKTVTRTIGRHIDSEVWFPWLVLGGIVLYFLLSLLLTNTPRLALAVKYLILTFVFLIEVVYIALLGNDFWFCEPEQVGWLKAILFTLVTLGVVFVEFNLFFSLLAEMKTESRDFNTSIGVILFTVIALVMFVYALFSGGLSDEENMWLIYALLGTQVLQVIISAVQLRRYPLFALMVILFIPLGTFAILLTALSVFKFLVFFAIIGLVLGGIANGRTGRPKSGYGSEGWELAKNCLHYIPSGSGYRLKHGEGCSLVYNGKCEFGRM
jgi:MFS family permease